MFILQWLQLMQVYRASLQQSGSGPESTGMENNEGVIVNQLASPRLGIQHWALQQVLDNVAVGSNVV